MTRSRSRSLGRLTRGLGLPNTRGRRPFLAAMVIDSLGTGVFLPFSVVYFLAVSDLEIGQVGVALSLAMALSLPLTPLTGSLIDRIGARRAAIGANVVQALGFAGYLVVDRFLVLVVFALLVAAGQNATWVANGALISECADEGERPQWFGLSSAFRNIGYGLGAILAGLAVSLGGTEAYRGIVVANIASFVAVTAVLAAWRGGGHLTSGSRSTGTETKTGRWWTRFTSGYHLVGSDRGLRAVLGLNLVFVLFSLVLTVTLPVYLIDVLRAPAWLGSGVFVVNTVLVVLLQARAGKELTRVTTRRALTLMTVLWAVSFVVFASLSTVGGVAMALGAVLGVVLYTGAEIICSSTMPSLVGALAEPTQRGQYFAVYQLTWTIPQVVAPAGFSLLLEWSAFWLWALLLVASAMTLLALALARGLPSRIG